MKKQQSKQRWTNWSGSVSFLPGEVVYPESLEEISAVVQNAAAAGRNVRAVGAGHSFTPLVRTGGVLLSLDRFQGVESVDRNNRLVTVRGGTTLRRLGRELHALGLAQENLGDIDVQSIAGAVSTGTHGTGTNFRTLAVQVAGLTLVTATGDVVEWTEDTHPDLLDAARVSLGMLGVVARVTLRVVPSYRLRLESGPADLDDVLDSLDEHQKNRHFEFFWFPHGEKVLMKLTNTTEEPPSKRGVGHWFNEVVVENAALWPLSEASRRFPRQTPRIGRLTGNLLSTNEFVGHAHQVFSTSRFVRFQEMEYNVPAESFVDCLREIKHSIERHRFAVNFPVECRFVRADEIWLSPAYGRDSAYLAVHMCRGMPYKEYFAAMEKILKRHDGRPHWGKMHDFTPHDVMARYPRAGDFMQLREELDPHGVFLNEHLRRTFGVGSLRS